jgi:hypothetical protein
VAAVLEVLEEVRLFLAPPLVRVVVGVAVVEVAVGQVG